MLITACWSVLMNYFNLKVTKSLVTRLGSLSRAKHLMGLELQTFWSYHNALTCYILNTLFRICGLLCIFFEWKGSISLPKSSIVDDIYPFKFEKTHETTVQTLNRLVPANQISQILLQVHYISVFCSIIFSK